MIVNIAYKAERAGVPVVCVDPACTSRECSRCHHIYRRNRPSQAVFDAPGPIEAIDDLSANPGRLPGWLT
ncbi:zinc ribbon domain-containing protein [Streptomyces sp. NPDC002324]